MLRDFWFLYNLTYICRDSRDCPAGRESRSVPALFVSRGTGTGTEVCGTSGTGTKNRGTVPSRPLPIPGLFWLILGSLQQSIKYRFFQYRRGNCWNNLLSKFRFFDGKLSESYGDGTFLFHLFLNVMRIRISVYFVKLRKISRSETEN